MIGTHGDGSPEALSRFHREAQAAVRVSHPALVRVFDHGVDVVPEGPGVRAGLARMLDCCRE